MAQLSKMHIETLLTIADSKDGFSYVKAAVGEALQKKGLVELNSSMTTEDGAIAARLTTDGEAAVQKELAKTSNAAKLETSGDSAQLTQSNEEVTKMTEPVKVAGFEIESGIEIPKISRVGRASKYPFEALEVGQSFHIPATDENPEPKKAMSSNVSTANARYRSDEKDENGRSVFERHFICREVDSTDPKGVGARVFRDK